MPKLIGAGASYDHLVANLAGGSDPSRGINPTKLRIRFRQQHIREIPFVGPGVVKDALPTVSQRVRGPGATNEIGLVDYTTSPLPVNAEGSVEVVDNDFTVRATLLIDDYHLVSGEDFAVGGSTALTAANIAATINSIPGLAASVAASTVTITGPHGLAGRRVRFEAHYAGSVTNFTLTPTTGLLADTEAEPFIGPPEIT